jgi:hypothetical protein
VIIKQELAESGIRTASLPEKKDIEYALAVCRVKKALKAKEESARRSKQAMLIADELQTVMKLTDSEIIDELHRRGIKLGKTSSREVLEGKLATARVDGFRQKVEDLEQPGSSYTTSSSSSNSSSGLKGDLAGMGQKLAKGVGSGAGRIGEKVSQFAKARTFTGAEKAAADLIEDSKRRQQQQQQQQQQRSSERDGSPSSAPASARELTEFDSELSSLSSFDEVVEWGKQVPRPVIVQLLESRGEQAPYYAPQPALVRLLADSAMSTSQTATATDQSGYGDGDVEGSSAAVGGSQKRATYRSGRTNSNKKAKTTALTTDPAGLDAFSFEQELFEGFASKMQYATSRVLDGAVELVSGEDTSIALEKARVASHDIVSSGAVSAIGQSVRTAANVGIDAGRMLGRWAGGNMLKPGQALFLSATYCIVRRRGLPTFLGGMFAIRLFRVVLQLDQRERDRDWEGSQQQLFDRREREVDGAAVPKKLSETRKQHDDGRDDAEAGGAKEKGQ